MVVRVPPQGVQLPTWPREDSRLEIMVLLYSFLDGIAIRRKMGGGRGHVDTRVPNATGVGEDHGGGDNVGLGPTT